MEFLFEYGMFLAKTATVVIALGLIIGLCVSAGSRGRKADKGHIEITKLNDKFDDMRHTLRGIMLDTDEYKQYEKAEKKRFKEEKAAKKRAAKNKPGTSDAKVGEALEPIPAGADKKRIFVLNFEGDIKASACESLRECISAVLCVAQPQDEVVVKVESGGGIVHNYGLAASQLCRIRQKNIPLTVCVDKVAASGGYLMACVADQIIAAPFAILGSIGVIAQLPNFHRLLKKNDIDYEMFTAGEYKRTVTMFGENTPKGREKFVEDLEDVHQLFKDFVSEYRQQVNITEVATGEIWFGRRALAVNLVDKLQTSDEYLQTMSEVAEIYEVDFTHKKTLPEKLGIAAEGAADRFILTWWDRLHHSRWFS